MATLTLTQEIPVKKTYDVIVAGGGVAGVAAALSAAKHEKSVLLLEKSNILGGLSTLGLVHFFVPMCNGRGKQIVYGMADEWARMSMTLGYHRIPEEWKDGEPKEPTSSRYCVHYSAGIFALQLEELIADSSVDILYDCIASSPVMENGHCKGVITESKSGREFYPAAVVVDTTGDADLLRQGGVPTVAGENFFFYGGRLATVENCKKVAETGDIGHLFNYSLMNFTGGNISLYGTGQPDNVPKYSGLTVEEVTDYYLRNHKIMLEKLKRDTDIFSRDLVHLSGMPNFRTTCRIEGDYTLTMEDAYRHFEDSVCVANDFDHKDVLFEVPYRCLIRSGFDNLITAGRSAAGSGYAWDILRVIPIAILTGQAAGEAAALAIETNTAIDRLDVSALQKRMEEANVMVHFDDALLPEDPTTFYRGEDIGHF